MKIKSTALVVPSLFLLGCSLLGKYSEVEYNNLIVEGINQSSLTIEATTRLYNETLPDVITEAHEIDISEMEDLLKDAEKSLKETESLLDLEARNIEQQNAVHTELETYRSAAELYLESYSAMLTYYGDASYKDDLTRVETLDQALHQNYTTFIEANNDLVDTLETFVTQE